MSKEELSEEDIKKSYKKISKGYFIAEWFEKDVRQKALGFLDVQEGEKVLEIGSGAGFAMTEIAKAVGKKGKAYGIDATLEMIESTKKRLEKKGLLKRAELSEGDARKMPYKENMFDAVYVASVVELFNNQDILKVLEEIKRVLKPKGRLVQASISKEGHEDSRTLRFYEWLHKRFPKYANCRPIYVEDSLKDAGFKIDKRSEVMIAGLFPMKVVAAKVK